MRGSSFDSHRAFAQDDAGTEKTFAQDDAGRFEKDVVTLSERFSRVEGWP